MADWTDAGGLVGFRLHFIYLMYSKLYKLRRVVYLASAGYVASAFYPNTSLLM